MNVDVTKIEELDADQLKIAQLLGDLKRVDAPGDFDFRLKARIAATVQPSSTSVWNLRHAAYAMPVLLVIMVATVLFMNQGETPMADAVQTAGISSQPSLEIAEEPAKPADLAGSFPQNRDSRTSETVRISNRSEIKPQPRASIPLLAVKTLDRSEVRTGGSVDRALRSATNSIVPREFDLNRTGTPGRVGIENKAALGDNEIFSMLGMGAEHRETGWTITSVRANTFADRSGLKQGDVIEAVDGSAAAKDSLFNGKFSGKVFTVRRDGRQIKIFLKAR